MKKWVWIVIAIIATIAIVAAALLLREDVNDKPVIKIGTILPITGGAAGLGAYAHHGTVLAVEHANKNPGNKYRYVLVSENTESNINRVPAIYNKLVKVDRVRALISIDSGAGQIIKPLAARDRITHISSAANNDIADGEFNFVNSTDMDESTRRIADWFASRGWKRVAFAGTEYPAAVIILGHLEPELTRRGIKVVAREMVAVGHTNLQAEIANIMRAKPDVVFLYAIEPHLSLFGRDLRRAGYAGMISGLYTIAYAEYPEFLNGAIWLDYPSGDDGFKEVYLARFGHSPNPASAGMYDNINILVRMFEGAGSVAAGVAGHTGVFGEMQLRRGGRLIHNTLSFFEMKNGKPVRIEVKE
ncbi:MAG: ABC transporter substrate-binding protein [Alphaproteobacteria bacterium]|nr:ABC transporter substrate-binding protein [Alphaproteobacteria bacterium]